jgi:hypothetical protein
MDKIGIRVASIGLLWLNRKEHVMSIPVAQKNVAHFVVSNFNADPTDLLSYSTSYSLYDQSDDPMIVDFMHTHYPNANFVANSGHSLTNYFSYLEENWNNLPSTIALLKSNVIGRHTSRAYFERNYANQHYTFLFDDPVPPNTVSSLLYESAFLEWNDSWYATSKPRRYFSTYNQVLNFLYVDPVLPKWVLFSPGACYIVPRPSIERLPPSLFSLLRFMVSYQYFPAEAYFVERILHTVFSSNTPLQPYIYNIDDAMIQLESLPNRSQESPPKTSLESRIINRMNLWLRNY